MATQKVAGLLLALIILASCSKRAPEPEQAEHSPEFRNIYQALTAPPPAAAPEVRDVGPIVSFKVEKMELISFLRLFTTETGIAVICEDELDERTVSLDVVDLPAIEVLGTLARRYGVDMTGSGRLYFLGEIRKADKGYLVRKVSRLQADDLREAIQLMVTENGDVRVFTDGLVVVADRVQVLDKIHRLLDEIQSAPADSWVVQLHIINISDRASREIGLDVEHLVELSANLAAGSAIPDTVSNWDVGAALTGTIRAASTASDSTILSEPLFVLLDGETATINQGERVPIPRRTVSDSGTVTTVGYDFLQTGITLEVTIRDAGDGQARLGLDVDLSLISGFVEEAPIVNSLGGTTDAFLASGGSYLLLALRRDLEDGSSEGPGIPTLFKSSTDASTFQVWARAYRIAQ